MEFGVNRFVHSADPVFGTLAVTGPCRCMPTVVVGDPLQHPLKRARGQRQEHVEQQTGLREAQ